jgi:diguanylate cyclase (GGDEF)-like protein/PAS domain S-box-containing protein
MGKIRRRPTPRPPADPDLLSALRNPRSAISNIPLLPRAEYETILDSVPALIFYKDLENRMIRVNRAFAEAMGLPKERLEGKGCSELWPDQAEQYWNDDLEVIKSGRPKRDIIEPLVTPDGTRWVQTDKIPIHDEAGRLTGIIGFAIDITERRRAEESVRALSLVDELTGLSNRRGFFALAGQQLKIAARSKTRLLLIFADVDELKVVNDTFGHAAGDQLLRDIARIFRETFRESDIIARIGGDEFVALVIASEDADLARILRRLRKKIVGSRAGAARRAGGRRGRMSLSIGMAEYKPTSPCSLEELIKRADEMMYEEKRQKRLRRVLR